MRRFNKSACLAAYPTHGGFYGIGIGGLTRARHIYEAGRSGYRSKKGRFRLKGNSYPQRLHQVNQRRRGYSDHSSWRSDRMDCLTDAPGFRPVGPTARREAKQEAGSKRLRREAI